MPRGYKLAITAFAPALLVWGVGYYAWWVARDSLSRSIETTSAARAVGIAREIDRLLDTRIGECLSYAHTETVLETLRASAHEMAGRENLREWIDEVDRKWREENPEMPLPRMRLAMENDLAVELRRQFMRLEDKRQNPVFGEVFVTNRHGVNLAQTGPTSDFRQDDEEWWLQAKEHGVFVGTVEFDTSAGVWSTPICIRIDDVDGEFLGVMKAALNLAETITILQSHARVLGTESDPHLLLLNSDRRVIYATDSDLSPLERSGVTYPANMAKWGVSTARKVDEEGKRWLCAFARPGGHGTFANLGWVVVLEQDEDVLFAPISSLKIHILLFAIAGTALAIALSGRVVRMAAARRAHIKELRRSEWRYRTVVETAANAIIRLDAEGCVRQTNPAAHEILGRSARELSRRPLTELVVTSERARVLAALSEARGNGSSVKSELSFDRPDGERRILSCNVSSFQGSDGGQEGTMGIVLVGQDVTHERELEASLSRARTFESIGQLAAGIAHEINSPMQYIGDNVRFVRSSIDPLLETTRRSRGEEAEYVMRQVPRALEQTLLGVERVNRIVAAMRAFSRDGEEQKEPADLNSLIESAVTVSTGEWKYHAEVRLDLDPEIPPLPCIAHSISQVFLNLVVNAAHAIADSTPSHGSSKGLITVESRCDGRYVEVRITDTGTGIPEEIRDRIFDPFFTTKDIGKGTGQGLSLVHAVVVQKHSGSIEFETSAGEGTTFVVRLPVDAAGATEAA